MQLYKKKHAIVSLRRVPVALVGRSEAKRVTQGLHQRDKIAGMNECIALEPPRYCGPLLVRVATSVR